MTFLNQIFYSCNKFDNATHLEKLNTYMLTSHNYKNIIESLIQKPEQPHISSMQIKEIIEETYDTDVDVDMDMDMDNTSISIQNESSISIIEQASHKENIQPVLFYPQKQNSLFWCVYIAHYGENEFHQIGNRYQNRELDEKQNMIQFIKKNPQKLKESNHKVTNVMIQELLSALMIHNLASLQDCIVYSIFYNKDIYVVKNSMYLFYHNKESETVSTENTIVIYCKNNKEYGLDLEVNEEKIAHIVNHNIRIFNTEKPLKGMSEYKIPDLEKMATILGIVHGKKKEMYDSIVEKCNWNI
jgi:hypothetical protein